MKRSFVRVAALTVSLWAAVAMAHAAPVPEAPRCRVFPPDSHWNLRVDDLPLVENSAEIVASIGADDALKPDFGAALQNEAPVGMPYVAVGRRQRKIEVKFSAWAEESDHVRYPIPQGAPTETGAGPEGERHLIIVQRGSCKLYELWEAHEMDAGWRAIAGAVWDLDSNRLRPEGWVSADPAGLPIFPGLVRRHEVKEGAIRHALRVEVETVRNEYIYPARNSPSNLGDPSLPAMGQRLRLRSSFDVSGFPRQVRVILVALKRYGMFVADEGVDWTLSGSPDARWNDDALARLGEVKGSDFEVVDTTRLARP